MATTELHGKTYYRLQNMDPYNHYSYPYYGYNIRNDNGNCYFYQSAGLNYPDKRILSKRIAKDMALTYNGYKVLNKRFNGLDNSSLIRQDDLSNTLTWNSNIKVWLNISGDITALKDRSVTLAIGCYAYESISHDINLSPEGTERSDLTVDKKLCECKAAFSGLDGKNFSYVYNIITIPNLQSIYEKQISSYPGKNFYVYFAFCHTSAYDKDLQIELLCSDSSIYCPIIGNKYSFNMYNLRSSKWYFYYTSLDYFGFMRLFRYYYEFPFETSININISA